MALTEIASSVDFVNWNEVELNAKLVGFYKEIKPSAKKGWDPTVYVESVDGSKLYGLGGKANLVRNLEENVPVGCYVEITYLGKKLLESGENKGSTCHQFKIAYDPDRMHPVFGGSGVSRQPVAYKREEPGEAPALLPPQQQTVAPQQAAPQEQTQSPMQPPPAAQQPAPSAQKRSFF